MYRFFTLIKTLIWLIFAFAGLGAAIGASVFLYLKPGLPSVQQLKETQLQIPLRIFSSDEKLLAEFGEKRRTPITVSDLPPLLVKAFLAAEDNRFLEHHGVDFKGLTRAASELATTGSIQSGGSTITMQVAKNFFLSGERTFKRKFTEILLALQIERELDKNEILELYLNKIYLGNRAYGVEAAAEVYYGKTSKALTLDEMAMIAGLPKAPSAYNPVANPQRALIRRNWILSRMLELGYIDAPAHQTATSRPNTAHYHGADIELDAPYIAEMVRAEMHARFGDNAYTDGYVVQTTVPSALQNAATQALRDGLESYDRRHGYRGPITHWTLDANPDTQQLLHQLEKVPLIADLLPAVVLHVERDLARVLVRNQGTMQMPWSSMKWANRYISADRRGAAPKKATDVVAVGDVVYVRITTTGQDDKAPLTPAEASNPEPPASEAHLIQPPLAQGALVSIEAATGDIIALTGGYSYSQSKYNRATQALRQPGSTFKPFVYLAALENGATAATVINDAPLVFDEGGKGKVWRPQNSSGEFYGPTRLREALYYSRNLVSIRLLQDTGVDKVIDYISHLGLDLASFPRNLSLALGTGSLPPAEMARGFAIIANGGFKVNTRFIREIRQIGKTAPLYHAPRVELCDECSELNVSTASNPVLDLTSTPKTDEAENVELAPRVADARSVYILHTMLQDVITKGTGRRALALGRSDIAGKTGTTNDQKDAWFVGFNHKIATSAWVGFDQPASLGHAEYGAAAALPIWMDFMKLALADTPLALMPQPPGLVAVRIDPATGMRASAEATNAIFEYFREDMVPEEAAPTWEAEHSIDGESGFMPQQLF